MKTPPRSIADLSHAVAAMLTTETSEQARFASMALCAEIMDRCDLHRDQNMRDTLRSWVGKVQARFNGSAS